MVYVHALATGMINGSLTLVTKSIPLAFKSVFTFGFGSFENKHTVTVVGLTIGCGKGLQRQHVYNQYNM